MKIGDIKIGATYGVGDESRRRRYGSLPRQVEVLEIVTEEKRIRSGDYWTRSTSTRKVRRIKVRFLDEKQRERGYYGARIDSFEKDAEAVIDARQFVAPWRELRADVLAQVKTKQQEEDARNTVERRLKAILPKRMHDDIYGITATKYGTKVQVTATLRGPVLEAILSLAEMGKIVDDSRIKRPKGQALYEAEVAKP